ncbi:MAG TPA: nuclear transport factor 2 family protein [Candidatus Micrarchaeia archaeon]|nr:nuclear transport factor 2 family protein [Candidatus Micrarchaeia archaeon]
MTAEIPDIVTSFLRIASSDDPGDAEAIAACFSEDAEVTDEGETRRGRVAIRQWWRGPATAYRYTVQVRGRLARGDDRNVLFVRLLGNFPGGVVDLAYRFTARDGLVSKLVISPPTRGEKLDSAPPT